jgi:uncharacterized protein
MLIEDMSRESSIELLKTAHLGHIACSRGGQPYVTPFSFVFDQEYLYGFASVGRKIEWMRANPLVCVEVEKIVSRGDWRTVVIFGRYEELPDTPEFQYKRATANSLLSKVATWWEPGSVRTQRETMARPFEPVIYRVSIDELTGHHATQST